MVLLISYGLSNAELRAAQIERQHLQNSLSHEVDDSGNWTDIPEEKQEVPDQASPPTGNADDDLIAALDDEAKNDATTDDDVIQTKDDHKEEPVKDQEQATEPDDQDATTAIDKPDAVDPSQEVVSSKTIALTFDDGPDKVYTPQVLDILSEFNIKATFFVTGLQVEKYGEVAKRIVEEGHSIGNHTYMHENLPKLTADQMIATVEKTDQLIEESTGTKSRAFRAPYGAMNEDVREVVASLGYVHTGWTVDTNDWRSTTTAQDIVNNVKRNASPGGIILMHSFGGRGMDETVKALPQIIQFLQAEGYSFTTIDTMNP